MRLIIQFLKKNDLVFCIIKYVQRLFLNSKLENTVNLNIKFNYKKNYLNRQIIRRKIIAHIFKNIKFASIIEAGTEYGFTTVYFSKTNIPVTSIEINKDFYKLAKKNIKSSKVKLINDSSENFFKNLLKKNKNKITRNTFFYLDSHFGDNYPLNFELKTIFFKFDKFIILIDDFEVPHDIGYGYDSHRNKKINVNYIKKNLIKNQVDLFFPAINSKFETGDKRGYLIISKGYLNSNYLQKMCKRNYLKKFTFPNK